MHCRILRQKPEHNRDGRASLRQRLALSYLILMLVLMITGILVYFSIMNREARQKYLDSVHYNLKQLAYLMDDQIGAVNLYTDVLARDKDIQYLSLADGIRDRDIVTTTVYSIIPRITEIMAQNKNIQGIRLIHGNRNIFDIYDNFYYDEAIGSGQWEARLRRLSPDGPYSRNGLFIEYNLDGNIYQVFANQQADNDVWYVYRSIYSSNLATLKSIVEVRLPNDALCQPIREYTCNQGEFVLLIGADNHVIFSGNDQVRVIPWVDAQNMEEQKSFRLGSEKYVTVSKRIEAMDCWLVQCVPLRNASMNSSIIVIYSLIILLLSIVFYFISRLAARAILADLVYLSDTMNTICHGNLEQRVEINSQDEIGILAENFNSMLERLKVATETEKKLLYRQLSDQISPHFLCNALDMVCMSAKVSKQADLSESISLISRYFRTNLSSAGGTVSISEEFAYVRDYIEISNLIRENPITYAIDVEEGLAKFQIPRFITQPFVENAMRHGFKAKIRNCHISIRTVRLQADYVSIIIEDNGSGIPEAKLQVIRDLSLDQASDDQAIGIANSLRRMQIYFGSQFDFKIESYLDVGTRVTLLIAG